MRACGIAHPDTERREALLAFWAALAVSSLEALVASFERTLRGYALALLFADFVCDDDEARQRG